MTVSNSPNGSVTAIGAGRRLVRVTARIMIAAALAAPFAPPLARPAAAQPAEAPAAVAPKPAETTPAETMAAPVPVEALAAGTPDTQAPAAAPDASAAQIPPAKKPHDLTPIGMFLNADPVVQGVMFLLAAASVVVWAILLMRGLGLLLAKRRLRMAIHEINSVQTLAEASSRVRRGTAARLLLEAEEEIELSRGLPSEGIKERVLMVLERVEAGVGRRMAVGTGILATVGSIGPFVGLFGTVWGIMRSFIGIANTNTTNLAVVAPGIAEALLATGIGLVAAIPAVVIYNALTRSILGYRAMCGDAVALIMRHVSRDLDRCEAAARDKDRSRMRVAAE